MSKAFRHVYICIGIIIVMTFLAGGIQGYPLQAEEKKVLRVAFPQVEGFTMTTPDGSRSGLVVDFLNEIAKYTNWEYEFIDAGNDTVLDQFLDGEFDLMGGNYYSEGLEEYFAYPAYNCGYSRLILAARRDDESLKSYDLNTLQGKTIGIFEKAGENARRLQQFLDAHSLECEFRYYSYEQLNKVKDPERLLENKEFDVLLCNSTNIGEDSRIIASFESQPHYLVTAPGNQDIIDGLNMALERIYEADPNFAQKLYEKYFPLTGAEYTGINEEEKEYVREKKTVTVAVPFDWHPISCLNNGDDHDGILPDILKEISDYSGLEFSYIYCESYAETLSKVQNGEADIVGFYLGSDETAAIQGFALTSSYLKTNSILVRNKESSYPAEGLTGGFLEGRADHGNVTVDEIKFYSNVTDALSDVNKGKVDFFYGISSHLEYVIQRNNYTNLVQVNLVNDSMNIGFALAQPVDPDLLTILNKAINSLSTKQINDISSRNIVSLGNKEVSITSIVYGNPALVISVVVSFLLLLLVAVILIFRSRLHAANIRNELLKAEADNRAKTEFLSRMSHEIRTPMNAIVGLTDLTKLMDNLPDKAMDNLNKIKSASIYLQGLINDILDMSRIGNGKMEIAEESFSLRSLLEEIKAMMSVSAEKKEIDFIMEADIVNDTVIGDSIRLRQVLINLISNAIKFTPDGGTVLAGVTETVLADSKASFSFRVKDNGIGIAPEDQDRVFESFEQVGNNMARSQGTGLGLPISANIVRLMGGELKLESRPGKGSEFYFTINLAVGQLIEEQTSDMPEQDMENLDFNGVNILIAEDNDLNAEIITELLQIKGAAVSRAINGREAVYLFGQSRPGTFQLILMDVLMPEMDGLEASRSIRRMKRQDAEVPILAMTANAFREDMEAAKAAGMDGFISKPIDVAYLYHEMDRFLKQDGEK